MRYICIILYIEQGCKESRGEIGEIRIVVDSLGGLRTFFLCFLSKEHVPEFRAVANESL
jgi:hypothetical protein